MSAAPFFGSIHPSHNATSSPLNSQTRGKLQGSDWRSNYTPAQLAAHERIKALRAKIAANARGREASDREIEKARLLREVQEAARRTAERKRAEQWAKRAEQRRKERRQISDLARSLDVPYDFARLVQIVSRQTGVSVDEIMSRQRGDADISRARQLAVWRIAKAFPKWSIITIGEKFGRNHTTVLHAIRAINEATGNDLRGMGGVAPRKRKRT